MSNKSRVIRVFLSSTFRDFAEERDLLVKKVFPELRRLCRERQVELAEVDLRWGITAEEAEQGKVLPICLGEIDRARPYFMGFIGDRYGWVPEGSQYPAGIVEREPWLQEHQGGKSVTELEMLHGVLNNPEMAGRAFFYFRDSNYSQGKGGDYLSEDDASAAKLEALKDRIRDSQFPVVEDYADPQALADKVRADLRALIEKEYPADEVPDDLTLERMRHEAYSQARRKLYIGGEQYFAQLDAAMSAEAARPVLISGEAGLGKSALIAKWLEGWCAAHPDMPVILHHLNATAEADDPMHLIRRLGEEAAVITGRPFEAAKSKDKILEQMPSILADLSGHAEREGLSVLIVLDGLERCGPTFEDLRWFPKYVPPHIYLLASCSDGPAQEHLQNFPLDWTRIELEPLSEGESRDFIELYLKNYRKSLTPAQAASILAHPLSGRPLWLITLLEELRLFGVHEELEARLETLLSDPPSKADGEAPTIDDLYEHVLGRIEEDIDEDYEEAAFKALWASYDGLARSELLELTGMPPAKWAEIQNALDENLFESRGQITFANDFIRKAVEDRHLPTEEKKRAAHRWLGDWFEGREVTLDVAQERVHQWRQAGDKARLRACLLEEAVFSELYKDARFLLAQWLCLEDDLAESYEDVFETWLDKNNLAPKLAGFLITTGFYGRFARALLTRDLQAKESVHGPDHADTLQSVINLADFLETKADLSGAEALLARVLKVQEKKLGLEHVDTLTTVSKMADLAMKRGDYDCAEVFYRRALQGTENTLGKCHSSFFERHEQLASFFESRGDLDEAELLYRRGLSVAEKLFRPEHSCRISATASLGWFLFNMRHLQDGERLVREALEMQEKTFGTADRYTRAIALKLVTILIRKNEFEEAEKIIIRLVKLNEDTLGINHPLTILIKTPLVQILDHKGETDEAIRLCRRLVEASSKVYGKEHPTTLDQVHVLATSLWSRGDLVGAEKNLRHIIVSYEKNYDAGHPCAFTVLDSLGNVLKSKGDLEGAEEVFRHLLGVQEDYFSVDHSDLLDTRASLFEVLVLRECMEEAEELCRSLIVDQEKVLGINHPDTLLRMRQLGILLSEKEKLVDFEEAEQLFLKVLEGLKCEPETELSDLAATNHQLGSVLIKLSRHEEAMGYFKHAIKGFECLPDHESDVLSCLLNLGLVCKNLERWEEAENYLRRALYGYQKTMGNEHALCGALLKMLGAVLYEMGDYEAAEIEYRRELVEVENVFGPTHPSTLDRVNTLGIFLNDQLRRSEAIKLFRSYASCSADIEDVLAYNLACYECLEGNVDEAKRLIAAHINKHPEKKEQALADEDFASIRDFIKSLPDPKNEQ